MSVMMGDRAWALRVADRYEAGKVGWSIAVKWASEVLGRPILRGGKHAYRPDTKDLQAGDLHEDRVAI